MSNETMTKLISLVRLVLALIVTFAGAHGLALDPTLVEAAVYVICMVVVVVGVWFKDNNITSARMAAQEMVDIIKADYNNNRRGEEDSDDIIEGVLELLDGEDVDDINEEVE
jgi:hypothetical protein